MSDRRTVEDFDELYPGRFIKACDCKDKPTFTIERAWLESLEGTKGVEMKGTVSFTDQDRDWVLNKTNGLSLKAMFGRKLSGWVGKRVTLFQGEFNGEPAIRVWGSPDIERDTEVTIELPRKRPFKMTMHCTAERGRDAAQFSDRCRELLEMINRAASTSLLDEIIAEVGRDKEQGVLAGAELDVLRSNAAAAKARLKGA